MLLWAKKRKKLLIRQSTHKKIIENILYRRKLLEKENTNVRY